MRTIPEATVLITEIVAESVCDRSRRDRSYAVTLHREAEERFQKSPTFRRAVRGAGNTGRDFLYAHMTARLDELVRLDARLGISPQPQI